MKIGQLRSKIIKIGKTLNLEKCENNLIENIDTFGGWLCDFVLTVLLNATSTSLNDHSVVNRTRMLQ